MEFLDRHAVTQVARSIEAAAQAIDAAANAILASRSDPLLEYLYKERDGFDAYHNQKETMAWAGVAVFLAATVAVATSVKKPEHWWETHALQQLVLTVTFFAVLAYTRRQFNLREWAARINEALTRKILEIVDGSATHAAGA